MLIGNTNTKRCHDPSCRAVKMIAPKHIQATDGTGFHVLCKLCGSQGTRRVRTQKTLEHYANEDEMGIEECTDKKYLELFEVNGCIDCHSREGKVLMHPHIAGVEVEGKPGKWWVYFECGRCKYETSYVKAINQIEKKINEIKEEQIALQEEQGGLNGHS